MSNATLRVGVLGLGRAFMLMLPTFRADPRVTLVAASDPRREARERFQSEFGGRTYERVEDLCADGEVDVVYVASPHQFHAEHVLQAAHHGKHMLVEKPLALTVTDCQTMVAAARAAGAVLIVGHSHSFNAPILAARALIESGTYGDVRMIHALNYTDFMYRPRRPEELATKLGGGVVYSQGAHQVDIARLLGGGEVRTVRARTGMWDPERPSEGAYSALLNFKTGAFATITYSGYAHYDSDELCGWTGELGFPKDPARYGTARAALREARSTDEEIALKNRRAYGSAIESPRDSPAHNHFGMILVSCDGADLRPTPSGVMIYADDRAWLDEVPAPAIPRVEVIDELYSAVVHGRSPIHDGEWAMATLEVCLAILESSRSEAEIALRYQVSVMRGREPASVADAECRRGPVSTASPS